MVRALLHTYYSVQLGSRLGVLDMQLDCVTQQRLRAHATWGKPLSICGTLTALSDIVLFQQYQQPPQGYMQPGYGGPPQQQGYEYQQHMQGPPPQQGYQQHSGPKV